VRVFSRNAERREAFARRATARHGIDVQAVASAREAVEGADLVCTVTASAEPVVQGEWLAPGAHVNAVGACTPAARELDTQAVLRAQLFVDRRESAENEAGDYLIPLREGAIGADHIRAELGAVLAGNAPGRTSPDEITLFESLGLAVEDLAPADHVVRDADPVPIGEAAVRRSGLDVTLISYAKCVNTCLQASEGLAQRHISAEVIDLRTIKPLDHKTVLNSVRKTGRVVIVHEAPRHFGPAGELIARLVEESFFHLEAPIQRVTGYDVHMPFFAREQAYLPDVKRIVDAAHRTLAE